MIVESFSKRLHRINFRCHLLCKKPHTVANKSLLVEAGVNGP